MYVEYYAIENLIVNYIIISCTSILTKNYTSNKKKIMGALIGMIYSLLYLIPNLDLIFTLPMKILTILIISNVSFSKKNMKEYIRILFVFYFVNIFIAGSSFFIIYFTGTTHITISLVIIISYISGIILKFIYKDIKELKYLNSMKKSIKICINKNEVEVKALIDTGNLVKDPITQEHVVIISANKLYDILPKEFQMLDFKNINLNIINNIISCVDDKISYRIRMIPIKQINDENLVLGIKSDYIEVDEKKIPNVILGLSNFNEEGYSAILNPQLLVSI